MAKGTNTYEGSGKKTLLETVVHMNSEIEGKCIKDVLWPKNCLVVAITRGDIEILPNGSTEILAGDYLTYMTDQSSSYEVFAKVVKLAQK